jgi:predicted DNA-binding transcriptional regulator AlpA
MVSFDNTRTVNVMNIIIDNKKYIDSEEVARKIGIAKSTLKVMVRAKEVPMPMKLKTLTFWEESEVDAYLEKIRDVEKDK